MPAYNFKPQFVPLIKSGHKRSTIRAIRKDGRILAKTGVSLSLYTGMRTKACQLITVVRCTTVHKITIGIDTIALNNRRLGPTEAQWIAGRDGFKSIGEMIKFFAETHGLPFSGNLIEW